MERAREILKRCGERLDLYSGDDATAIELILLGGKADISVTANVAPQLMHDMCAAALAGDREKAMKINSKLADLHKVLFLESNPIPVKWALHEMDLIPPGIRLPLTPLAARHHASLRRAMKQADLL